MRIYEELSLIVSVENYGSNEKIFELSQRLDESNVWEGSCPAGSIAWFSLRNNIAMYYGDAPERAQINKENCCLIKKNMYNRIDYIRNNCRRKQSRNFFLQKKQKKGD